MYEISTQHYSKPTRIDHVTMRYVFLGHLMTAKNQYVKWLVQKNILLQNLVQVDRNRFHSDAYETMIVREDKMKRNVNDVEKNCWNVVHCRWFHCWSQRHSMNVHDCRIVELENRMFVRRLFDGLKSIDIFNEEEIHGKEKKIFINRRHRQWWICFVFLPNVL